MTDQSNLFNQPIPAVDQQQPTAPVQDPLQDLLASIKNEQGQPKYKDIPTALGALNHSQAFIDQLKAEKQQQEAELARLKAELDKRAAVEDVVSRLAQGTSNAGTTNTEVLTPEQIAAIVTKQLEADRMRTTQVTNLQTVNQTLIQRFGDKAGEVLSNKAKELGITVQQIGQLAEQSPQAVLAYFPVAQQQPATSSGLNTSAFQGAPSSTDIPAPSKSMLSGASSKDQAAYMAEIRKAIHDKYGVTQS